MKLGNKTKKEIGNCKACGKRIISANKYNKLMKDTVKLRKILLRMYKEAPDKKKEYMKFILNDFNYDLKKLWG